MKFMSVTLLTLAQLCVSIVFADAPAYVICGSKQSSHRLVVSSADGYSKMQVYKRGEKKPSADAVAALLFRRCVQGPCQQVPTDIKTIDSSPSYSLSLPWRAMESDDKFTAVLTEQSVGRLGEPVSKTFNLICQPGVKNQELIASTRSNK